MGVDAGDFDAKESSGPADVTQRLMVRKVEFCGEGFEVQAREAGHRAQELFKLCGLGVESLEQPLMAVLDFVLGLAVRRASGRSSQ